mgnify:CR=1 FL=1
MGFDWCRNAWRRWPCSLLGSGLAALVLTLTGCSGLQGARNGAAADAGVASTAGERNYVFEDIGDWIALAPADAGVSDNDHPVRLSASGLRTLLAGVDARLDPSRGRGLFEDGDGRRVRVFTDATLDEIAEPLARAFARAKSSQDVILRVAQAREGKYLEVAGERVVTTARLFHRDGRLHILFGVVDAQPQGVASTDAQNTPKSGSYRSPAARSRASLAVGSRERSASLQASLHAEGRVDAGPSGRDDWLVLAAEAGEPKATQSSTPSDDRQEGPERVPLSERADALEELDDATIERLRELRELRRRDLIDAKTYESMVRELLGIPDPGDD